MQTSGFSSEVPNTPEIVYRVTGYRVKSDLGSLADMRCGYTRFLTAALRLCLMIMFLMLLGPTWAMGFFFCQSREVLRRLDPRSRTSKRSRCRGAIFVTANLTSRNIWPRQKAVQTWREPCELSKYYYIITYLLILYVQFKIFQMSPCWFLSNLETPTDSLAQLTVWQNVKL